MPVAVMKSAAFMTAGISSRHVIDALVLENAKHAGRENSRLIATYDQLVEAGISRRKIPGALADLDKRGLVRRTVIGSGNRKAGESKPSQYRLTFFGTETAGPTDEWRDYIAPKRLPRKPPSGS